MKLLRLCLLFSVSAGYEMDFEVNKYLMCDAIESLSQIYHFSTVSTIDFISDTSNSRDKYKCFKTEHSAKLYFSNVVATKSPITRKKNFVVIFFDSRDSLEIITKSMSPQHFNYHGYFLVILSFTFYNEINLIFHQMWRMSTFWWK